jgi:hypothetical protein
MKRLGLLMTLASMFWGASILMQSAGACANDTIARIGAGGITFEKTDDIRMLEEALEISTKEIKVKYKFLNEADRDIHAMVAFAAPAYAADSESYNFDNAMRRLVDTFKVLVDGQPVSPEVNRKAVVRERDVTAQLRELGLSDKQIFDSCHGTHYWQTYCDLSKKQKAKLEGLKVDNKPLREWKVATTLFWRQTFLAGKAIVVEHTYVPVVGGMYGFPYSDGVVDFSQIWTAPGDEINKACLDERTKQAIQNRIKAVAAKNPEYLTVTLNHVEYILSTGRNWKGPIGEFKLRLKKETPEEVVSVCFPGQPKKLGPTLYEFTEKSFVPDDRLIVYFYNVDRDVHFVR